MGRRNKKKRRNRKKQHIINDLNRNQVNDVNISEGFKPNDATKSHYDRSNLRVAKISAIILFFTLVVTNYAFYDSSLEKVPRFTLQAIRADSGSTNHIMKLYHSGNEITNPSLNVHFVVSLEIGEEDKDYLGENATEEDQDKDFVIFNPDISTGQEVSDDVIEGFDETIDEDENYLVERVVTFEISDYFPEYIGYDNEKKSFTIQEKYRDSLYDFLDAFYTSLRKNHMALYFFSFRQYYELSYIDYKGNKHNVIYEPKNNYAHMAFTFGDVDNVPEEYDLTEISELPSNDGEFTIFGQGDKVFSEEERIEKSHENMYSLGEIYGQDVAKDSEVRWYKDEYVKNPNSPWIEDTEFIIGEGGFCIGYYGAY